MPSGQETHQARVVSFFKKTRIRFGMSLVQFEKFGSVGIQLFTADVTVEQLIYSEYYSITATLNELHSVHSELCFSTVAQ